MGWTQKTLNLPTAFATQPVATQSVTNGRNMENLSESSVGKHGASSPMKEYWRWSSSKYDLTG